MHGQYTRSRDRQLISEEDMFLRMSRGDLKAETENEIIVAQDQALQTKYYVSNILQTERNSKYRLCKQLDETVEHIISACLILAEEQYIKRHDRVCVQLHFNICKDIGVKWDNEQWYDYVSKRVKTSRENKVKILWNQQV